MATLNKQIQHSIGLHAREGFEDALQSIAKNNVIKALEQDHSMHVNILDDHVLEQGCAATNCLLSTAKAAGISDFSWLEWEIVISPVSQSPEILVIVDFENLMAEPTLCKAYLYEDIDEDDEILLDPVSTNIELKKGENPLGNIIGSFVKSTFISQKTDLPILVHFSHIERVSALSAWEYQVSGRIDEARIMKLALNLRLLKHAGDRLENVNGGQLFIAIQHYYENLFGIYANAQYSANLYSNKTRGIHIGNSEVEAKLRSRLSRMNNERDVTLIDTSINLPQFDYGLSQDTDWFMED